MYKKKMQVCSLVLMEVMLQLLYFWMNPMVACKWVVYSIVTVMTVVHLALVFWLNNRLGVRKSIAIILLGSFIQVFLVSAGGASLLLDVTPRSSLFLLSIISVLYVVVMIMFGLTLESSSSLCNTAHPDGVEEILSRTETEIIKSGEKNPPPLPGRQS